MNEPDNRSATSGPPGTIDVLLADDNLIVREGVRALIARHPDLRVVGVAAEANLASRTVLGSIGMVEVDRFWRDGNLRLVYQSVRQRYAG